MALEPAFHLQKISEENGAAYVTRTRYPIITNYGEYGGTARPVAAKVPDFLAFLIANHIEALQM